MFCCRTTGITQRYSVIEAHRSVILAITRAIQPLTVAWSTALNHILIDLTSDVTSYHGVATVAMDTSRCESMRQQRLLTVKHERGARRWGRRRNSTSGCLVVVAQGRRVIAEGHVVSWSSVITCHLNLAHLHTYSHLVSGYRVKFKLKVKGYWFQLFGRTQSGFK